MPDKASGFRPIHRRKQRIFASSKFIIMKIRVVLLFVVLTGQVIASRADAPANLEVTPGKRSGLFNFCYRAAQQEDVRVSIYNQRNERIFTEIIRDRSSFNRPYNFEALEEGEYRIATEARSGKKCISLSHYRRPATSIINISKVVMEEDRYRVRIATEESEQVMIRIMNNRSELVLERDVQVDQLFDSIFNLKNVPSFPGSVLFFEVTTSGGQVETAMFNFRQAR
jgi:hypothetical protein